jgi:hypothetical protein
MMIMIWGLQTIFSMNYAGFGLGTANIFRKMIGLQEATWSKEEENKKDAEVEYETWKVEENITF